MSLVLQAEPTTVAVGDGWRAEHHFDHIYLAVDSASGRDILPEAVAALLPEPRRRFWLVEHMGDDFCGQEIYLLSPNSV